MCVLGVSLHLKIHHLITLARVPFAKSDGVAIGCGHHFSGIALSTSASFILDTIKQRSLATLSSLALNTCSLSYRETRAEITPHSSYTAEESRSHVGYDG